MTTTPDALAGLAARLTDPTDRETYAALLLYRDSLPPGDEVRQMLHLFGLLSLLGQRVPAALADAMTELRELNNSASDYHDKINQRLANLPGEIADGLNVEKMGEAFRQQFTATGLQTSAGLLRDSSREISALSNEICATLAPLSQKYETVTAAIDKGITRLTAATEAVERQNGQLIAEQHSWPRQAVYVMVIFLLGGLCGVVFENRQTADVLTNVNAQIERIQTPVAPPVAASVPKRIRKGS